MAMRSPSIFIPCIVFGIIISFFIPSECKLQTHEPLNNRSFFRNGTLDESTSHEAHVIEKIHTPDGRRLNVLKKAITCTVWRVEVRYLDHEEGHWECEITDPLFLQAVAAKSRDFRLVGDSVEELLSSINGESGVTSLKLSPGVEIDAGAQELKVQTKQVAPSNSLGGILPDHHHHQGRRNLANAIGDLEALVVRVNALDASPPAASQLANDIFEDEYCLKSQYARCSFGQLNINAATGLTVPSAATGVVDVSISITASGNKPRTLHLSANEAALNLFGLTSTQGLDSIFDLVLFVLPPGTQGGLIAYAYLGGAHSVYNDFWSGSLSTLMHEVGHNIGLGHSGMPNGDNYGDQMGMMGYVYNEDDGPLQCFNPPKNWQLQWYKDKGLDLNARLELQSGPKEFILNGVVDYNDDTTNQKYIVIKIGNYYIGYNKQADFNSGTKSSGNKVTVQKKLGSPYAGVNSERHAVLDVGASFPITEENVRVQYVRIDNSNDAVIELSLLEPDNNPCNAELEVVLTTDNFPGETFWNILDASGTTIYSGDKYTQRSRRHSEKVFDLCRDTEYTFSMFDRRNNGLCCAYGNGGFEVRSGGRIVFSQYDFTGSQSDFTFMIPSVSPTTTPPTTAAPTTAPPTTAPPTTTPPTTEPPTTAPPTTSPPTTSQPTIALPTAQPSSEFCEDESSKFLIKDKGRERTCKWLARKPRKRRRKICRASARRVGEDVSVKVKTICEKTCKKKKCLSLTMFT